MIIPGKTTCHGDMLSEVTNVLSLALAGFLEDFCVHGATMTQKRLNDALSRMWKHGKCFLPKIIYRNKIIYYYRQVQSVCKVFVTMQKCNVIQPLLRHC